MRTSTARDGAYVCWDTRDGASTAKAHGPGLLDYGQIKAPAMEVLTQEAQLWGGEGVSGGEMSARAGADRGQQDQEQSGCRE